MDEAGQCLPGPTSTQVSFAIGLLKKGVVGGLLSGMLFQYPGLLMMSFIGWGAEAADWENRYFKGAMNCGLVREWFGRSGRGVASVIMQGCVRVDEALPSLLFIGNAHGLKQGSRRV